MRLSLFLACRQGEISMIRVEHLSKRFGHLEVLKDINVEIDQGEVNSLRQKESGGKPRHIGTG